MCSHICTEIAAHIAIWIHKHAEKGKHIEQKHDVA